MKEDFDLNHILHDRYLQSSSAFDVQAFLRSIDSDLATLSIEEKPVSAILEQVAHQQNLDVRVLLVKLQVEQGLITGEATDDKLRWALGYGLTDVERFEEYGGFATQLEMAARALTGYLKESHPFSVVDQVGQPMNVRDGLVTPANLATAALYRYTPWIGFFDGEDSDGGDLEQLFGNALFFQVWLEFFGQDPRLDPAPDTRRNWRVISPPDNWKKPIATDEAGLAVLEQVSQRLGLVTSRDEQRAKFYVGLPRPTAPPDLPDFSTGDTVTYPSGRVFHVVEPSWADEALYAPAVPEAAAPLITADDDAPLSQHFKMSEFRPRDPKYRFVRISPELIRLLEELRAAVGHPLLVNSGYRPKAYNASVGGASLSTHIDGLAADISCLQVPTSVLHQEADKLVGDRGGVGYYPSQEFVHVDLRGTRVRWQQ